MSGGGGTKTYGKSAYMLVYERKSKKDLRVVDQTGEEEKVSKVGFRQVEQFVPDWINELVAGDNKTFIVDQNVFSDQFFNTIKNIFKYINTDRIMGQYGYPQDYIVHFDTMKEACLEISGKVTPQEFVSWCFPLK